MPKKPNQPTPQERRRSRKAFRQAMTKELREHRSSFLVFSVLRVLIVVALVRQLMRGAMRAPSSACWPWPCSICPASSR